MRRVGGFGQVAAVAAVCAILLALTPGTAAATPASVSLATGTEAAVGAATATGLRAAVAVVDTADGTTTTAGEATALFPSESVVKVLVAARLLVEGRMDAEVESLAAAMIASSDDDAANLLWGEAGGPDLVRWAVDRYGLTGLEPPSEWGWWGNTKMSAVGIASTYAALAADPLVAPWLRARMAAATPTADDGTDQVFGLRRAEPAAEVKQGWGGDDDDQVTANLLSTGYLAGGRVTVAVVVQDPDGGPATRLAPTVDAVAGAVVADVRTATASTAADEAAAPAATTAPVPRAGGASAAVHDDGPGGVGVLLAVAALLGLLGAGGLSVAWRRRATAPPS